MSIFQEKTIYFMIAKALMKRVYVCTFFLVLSFTNHIYSQNLEDIYQVSDSLKNKSYGYLYKQLYKNINNTKKCTIYLSTYLRKATVNNDTLHRIYALSNLALLEKDNKQKIYLIETALSESENLKSPKLVTVYGIAGLIYTRLYQYEKAIEHHLKALEISKKYKLDFYIGLNLHSIAEIKSAIGKYDEALLLYKKRYSYLTSTNKRDSLNPIGIMGVEISIAKTMRQLKKYDSATYYYNRISSKSINDSLFQTYIDIATINEGINQYYKGNYINARKKIKNTCDSININDFTTFYSNTYILSQFYLGKLNLVLTKDQEITERYFRKVDSLLITNNTYIPETREIYEFLLKKYEKEKEFSLQIQTISKILALDSIINARKINTINKLHTEFDIPTLIKNREIAISNLEHTNSTLTNRRVYLISSIFILALLFAFQYRKHKIYKKRFNKLIAKSNLNKKKSKKPSTINPKDINIDEKLISKILDQLEYFEKNQQFLKSNITINLLAKNFSTNTRYLSKIINVYKGKTFTHYTNDLRINYILEELKNNTKLQRYTIKGISEEAGFNNSESFTTAFKKTTGIKPSYFIKNISKTQS